MYMTTERNLIFGVNGIYYGAACTLPADVTLFVVVDLRGKAEQISIIDGILSPAIESKS